MYVDDKHDVFFYVANEACVIGVTRFAYLYALDHPYRSSFSSFLSKGDSSKRSPVDVLPIHSTLG